MKVVSNKQNIVYINPNIKFRDVKIALSGKSSGTNKVFLTSLSNPYLSYAVRTVPLSSDTTYQIKVESVDNLNNRSVAVQGGISIPVFTLFPRFITFEYLSSHAIRLSWTEPADGPPDNYVIYSNNGSGVLDHDHHYQLVAGDQTSVDMNITNNSLWLLKVEALKDEKESRTNFMVEVQTPAESVPPPILFETQSTELVIVDPDSGQTINSTGNAPDDETGETVITGTEDLEGVETIEVPGSFSGVTSANINTGKIGFSFLWIYGDLANRFRLYHDSGSGVIDFGVYIEFERTNSFVQSFTTGQIYNGFDDKEFRFVVRAVNSFDVEDINSVEHRVLLDGSAPEEIENLVIGVDIT